MGGRIGRHGKKMHRLIGILLFLALPTFAAWAVADESSSDVVEFDFGPIMSRQRDLHGDLRLRILGPLFEQTRSDDGKQLTAVRPLYSRYTNPEMEHARSDYLWPLGYSRRFRDDHTGRVLLSYWTRFDLTDPESRYRFWLFPIYFQGRDKHGQSYAAVFPIGGRIHEFLGWDEISFILFPLYGRTELNTIVTHNYLWPVVSQTDGKGIYRFRVFPFYGQNRHRDRYSKKFVLWPFWTSAEYYHPGSSGSGYILFPLWGHLDLDDQQSYTVLPPFFQVSRGDRVNKVVAPWPIFQRRTGEVRETRVWPLWGQKRMRGVQSRFFLWPIFTQERVDRGESVAHRFYAVPFYYSDVERMRDSAPPPLDLDDPVPRGEIGSNYQKIWPLFSYIREDQEVRFRMLDLSPLKHATPIERNYAPFWTLFQNIRYEENSDTEALWGLYRRHRRGDDKTYTSVFPLVNWTRDDRSDESVRRWSLLKGLLGYQREGTTTRYQFLYLLRWQGELEEAP